MMVLRELKTEVELLEDIEENIRQFNANWLISANSKGKPLLEELSPERRHDLRPKLSLARKLIREIKESKSVHDKFRFHIRCLIELKLNTLRGDRDISRRVTNTFLNDDYLNISNTIIEVKLFEEKLKELLLHYDEINGLLQRELTLDQSLAYMALPHGKYLDNLQKLSQQQKKIIKEIGQHFVSLIKENKNIKRK